ncbi:MAG: transglycosylase SLT domain-containing protein [Lachnospiraceae bacterium]|nr:transglycosylase SLT domain-containing protein [Lachnospiraceae bacterium]
MRKSIMIMLILLIVFASIPTVSAKASLTDLFLKETPVSKEAYEAAVKYGNEYNVDPFLVIAVIEKESGGKSHVSGGGCYGLMGISRYWNRKRMRKLSVTNLYDETQNVKVGANLLGELVEKYGEGRALMCYNCGEGGAKRLKHLSGYAKSCLNRRDALKEAYETAKEKYEVAMQNRKKANIINSARKKAVQEIISAKNN